MKTKRQEELVNAFLAQLDDENRALYGEITGYLAELGYNPYRQRSYIVFKHDAHGKQMAKVGVKNKKEYLTYQAMPEPYFALRFSACRGYSRRFEDIVRAAVSRESFRQAACLTNECGYCAGEPATHVYACEFPDGESRSHCGAHALVIPGVTLRDIEEIKQLLKEEHRYLMKHQAGVEVE